MARVEAALGCGQDSLPSPPESGATVPGVPLAARGPAASAPSRPGALPGIFCGGSELDGGSGARGHTVSAIGTRFSASGGSWRVPGVPAVPPVAAGSRLGARCPFTVEDLGSGESFGYGGAHHPPGSPDPPRSCLVRTHHGALMCHKHAQVPAPTGQ